MFDKIFKSKKNVVHKIDMVEDYKGKDNRTFQTKVYGLLKILAVAYLIAVHFFAALYFTQSHLVLRVETAQKIISPLAGN